MESIQANIFSAFLQATEAQPEAVALIHDNRQLTYRQLLAEVRETAAYFRKKGLQKEDKVLVFVPMSLELYRTVLALLYLGACPVFLDGWVGIKRLRECLQTVPCKGIIAPPAFLFLSWAIKDLRQLPVRLSTRVGATEEINNLQPAAVFPENTALVTFTTGSTGTPKAADRTHAFLAAQLQALSPLLQTVPSPCLTTLPIVVLLHLAAGRTTLLPTKRFKITKTESYPALLEDVLGKNARAIISSPSVLKGLVTAANGDFSSLQTVEEILTGGGPVYPVLAAAMKNAFPHAKINAVYGSTEAEPISHIDAQTLASFSPEAVLEGGLPVCFPDASAQVRIVKMDVESVKIQSAEALDAATLPENSVGEILVSGAHVLQHYIHNPEAEAEVKIRIGKTVWHRTGDCGRLDANGSLYFMGRCKDAFEWNGQSYFPDLITYYLSRQLQDVAVAVLFYNNRPLVLFENAVPVPPEVLARLLQFCSLAEAPVAVVPKIPKDPLHHTKTDYAALQKMVREDALTWV